MQQHNPLLPALAAYPILFSMLDQMLIKEAGDLLVNEKHFLEFVSTYKSYISCGFNTA